MSEQLRQYTLRVLRRAVQFARVVSDWHYGEFEVDGEMVSVYDLVEEFEEAVGKLEGVHE